MRIAVFGSTGGLGRQVVRQALERGHEVAAHVRTPGKLGIAHPGLTEVQGDFGDAGSVRAAVQGADAVVSCVGLVKGQDPELYGRGMRHVVEAMQDGGPRRLVSISGAGLELEGDVSGFARRVIVFALKLLARDVLRGKELEWQVIRDAVVDWTLVRVSRMVEAPAKGRVAVDERQVSGQVQVAYADVASWMLDQLGDPTWVHETPFVSGAS